MMRTIDTTNFGQVDAPTDFGAVPMLQWVPIADLVVDDSYQREIRGAGRKNVETIAAAFQWIKFSPVVVSPVAGGKFAIIDGQHRVTAAALIGITEVPCQVVVADRSTQAEAFVAINGGATRVSRQQVFAAQKAAGDPLACAVAEACESAGVRLLRYQKAASQLAMGETLAVGAIESLYRQHGRDLLIATLRCILASSEDYPGNLCGPIIKAIGVVLGDHPEWSSAGEALISAFREIDLEDALRDARAKAARMRGVAAGDLLQASIIDHLDASFGRRAA